MWVTVVLVLLVFEISFFLFVNYQKRIYYEGTIELGGYRFVFKDNLNYLLAYKSDICSNETVSPICDPDNYDSDSTFDDGVTYGTAHEGSSQIDILSGQTPRKLERTCIHEICHNEYDMDNEERFCKRFDDDLSHYPICDILVIKAKERGKMRKTYPRWFLSVPVLRHLVKNPFSQN